MPKTLPPDDVITVHIPERPDPNADTKGETTAADTYSAPAKFVDSALRRFGRSTVDELRAHIADTTNDLLLEHVRSKATLVVIIASLEHEADLFASGAVRP